MHPNQYINWSHRPNASYPASSVLSDTLGADLNPTKSSSVVNPNTSNSTKQQQQHLQPSSPSALPSKPSLRVKTLSTSRSAPTSPLLHPSSNTRSSSGTDLISATNRSNVFPSWSQRPFSSYSIKTDANNLMNAAGGSVLNSPTTIPSASSSQFAMAPEEIRDSLMRDYSLTRGFGDPPMAINRSNSGGNSKRQQPEPLHHFFANPRSISFTGGLAYPVSPVPLSADVSGSQFLPYNPTSHGLAENKPIKKGIKNRLRRLRRKQKSSSRDASAYITSGESDSEAAFDPESETMFNTGGIVNRFVPSMGGSSRSSTRSRIFQNDPSFPPQLPPRNNSNISNSSSIQGQGKAWLSGSEHGNDSHKESSTVRLKGLLKSVGLSNQNSTGQVPVTPDQLKPVQPRGSFPLFGDFLSGDDQPASKVFSLKRPGRRKKRWTKKPHSTVGGSHAPVTDDEDTPVSKFGRRNHHSQHSQQTHHNTHHHQIHHSFLHWHPRRRSRSIDVSGSHHHPIIVQKQEPSISAALREARQANQDPNVLIVELEPLPANFQHAFAELSSTKISLQQQYRQSQLYPQNQSYGPLVSYITPSSTTSSTLPSAYYGPIGNFTNYQTNLAPQRSAPAKYSSTFGTKTFLFKSYENTKFQGHYIFRVVGDNVEYKKLPLELEQSCSQYFREACVTYRSLENKAKLLKEELQRRRAWARKLDSEDRADRSVPLNVAIPRSNRDYTSRTDDMERRNDDAVLKSALAWDQAKLNNSYVLTESPTSTPTRSVSRYLDQRYDPQTSNNNVLKGITSEPDRTRSDPLNKNVATDHNINTNNGRISFQPTQRSALYHSRRRSWSSINEHQHSDQQNQLAAEEATWREMERKYREEFQQSTFGLELFLAEIIKGSEYEIFDAAADVAVYNEKGTNVVFTIVNGDRTNVMYLESPSAKLKCEFLNWIAISTMDQETEDETVEELQVSQARKSNLDFLIAGSQEESSEGVDLMYEMIELRITQQQERLRDIRDHVKTTKEQIISCLNGLDKLSEDAKDIMTKMIRDIDSQEVQSALTPSPTTGVTLASTIEEKINHVEEKIKVSKRIIKEGQLNLSRLRYEIELEQRSIRLFRQYKIVITVVTFSIVFVFWFLYHSRMNVHSSQPSPPLFRSSVNPFKTNYHFHHGGPIVSTPPASTCTISVHDNAKIDKDKT